MLNVTARQITVGDYRFHLIDGGHGQSDRPPILFLHGFMGSCDDWVEVMECLSDRPRCIAVDLPGHGQTQMLNDAADPNHPAFQMAPTAQALMNMLEQLSISVCDLVGYSMGGRLALYLAIYYPNRIRRLVLESASAGLATESEREARRQHDASLAQQLTTERLESFLQRWYRQPLFASLSRHPSFTPIWQRRLRNRPEALARSLRHMGTGQQPSLWNAIRHHAIPTLVLVGENDAKFRAIAAAMCDRCVAMTSVVVPGCAHTIHGEQLAQFVALIHQFLD